MAYRKLESIELGRGRALRNYEISRVQLSYCTTAIDQADSLRPLIGNVRVEKLKVRRSHLGFAVLRNVVFEGIDTDVFSSFLFANEYYGVTLRGAFTGSSSSVLMP